MKKIISILALFSILFSSMGTSFSVYAEDVLISKSGGYNQKIVTKNIGLLSEKNLFELLKNREVSNDGLVYLINLKGNLTKTEKKILFIDNAKLERAKSKLSIKLKSKLDGLFLKIYQKLAKGGLTKEQNIEFSKLNIKKQEEKKEEKPKYDINKLLKKRELTKDELVFIIKNKYISTKGLNTIFDRVGYQGDREVCFKNPGKQSCLHILARNGLQYATYFFLKRDGEIANHKFSYKAIGGLSFKLEDNEDDNIQNNNTFFTPRTDTNKVGAKAYQVNFKTITRNGGAGSLKAGKIQARFKGKLNFPKKLILPEGFTYDIKTDALDAEFVKTKALQQKINNLSVDVGQIVLKEPELRILPDRIEYVKKTVLVFKNETQLRNIKANLSNEFGDENISSMLNQIKQVKLENIKDLKAGKITSLQLDNLQKARLNVPGLAIARNNGNNGNNGFGSSINMPNLSNQAMTNGYNSDLFRKAPGINKIKRNAFARFNQLSDENFDSKVVNDCLNKRNLTQKQKNSCRDKNNYERVIETEEVIGYGLIPSTIEDLRKNKKSLIALDPKDIVMSRDEIMGRFAQLRALNLNKNQIGDNYENVNGTGGITPRDIYAREDYCSQKFKGKGTEEKSEEDLISECNSVKAEMLEKTPQAFKQDLLNGFTIGESKSYKWGTSASVYIPFVGSIKLFKTKLTLSYGYGFGIRIPIHVEGGVDDDKVYAFSDSEGNKGAYKTWIKADTLDADANYYKKLLTNKEHIYKGKEFVFEFTANANVYIWIKGLGDGNVDIPLVSTLIVGLVAADSLVNQGSPDESMARVAELFGIQKGNAVSLAAGLLSEFFDLITDLGSSETNEGNDISLELGLTDKELFYIFNQLAKYTFIVYGDKLANHGVDLGEYKKFLLKLDEIYEELPDGDFHSFTNGITNNNLAAKLRSTEFQQGMNDFIKLLNIQEFNDTLNDPKINTIATILQSSLLTHFIVNNGIDLSKNFKPPFDGHTIPLYRFESPEIPLYMDGLFKMVAKLGVKSKLGGRVTTKCEEVNSVNACPMNIYTAGEFHSDETSITYEYNDKRLHLNTTGEYYGSGYAIDGPENEMINDPILDSKYSKFGIKFSDFRYHPELIFTLFTKAGAGVHLPYIGWATYWTPDIDLYTMKFSSDDLYLGPHYGTITIFDMTQTKDGKVNRVYTVLPPEMLVPNPIGVKNDYGNTLYTGPTSNTKGGNNIYFKVLTSNVNVIGYNRNPACAEENGTKLYLPGKNELWPTYKTNLENYRSINIGVVACNTLYERTTDVVRKDLQLKNIYHIPFFVLQDNTTEPSAFVKVERGTTLNIDYDEGLYLTMNSIVGDSEISKNDDTKEYIKYQLTENESDFNLTCSNGTQYDGEKFEFSNNIPYKTSSGAIISLGHPNIQEIGVGSNHYLQVVKCVTKSDGSVFQSLKRTIQIMAYSSGAHNSFVDKLRGGAVMQQVKQMLEHLGDFRADILGGMEQVGGGKNPNDFYSQTGYQNMSSSMKSSMKALLQTKVGIKNGMFKNLPNGAGAAGAGAGTHQYQTFNNTGTPPPAMGDKKGGYGVGVGNKYSQKYDLSGNQGYGNYMPKYGSGYFQKNDGDGITRIYAKTRYPGCKENDIVIGNKVFAMCNSKKDGGGRSVVNGSENAKDKHGWEFGRYYLGYYGCESGYRRITENDLKGINNIKNILKIPYAGYRGNNSGFVGMNSFGLYISDTYNSLKFSDNKNGYEKIAIRMYSNFKTVRCIRNTLATDEELGINSGNSQGSDGNGDANNQNNNLTSTDEYVNEKLSEINECFLNTYNSHLKNLDDTIKKFKDTKNSTNNEKTKQKYEKAIKKLEEIKNLFIRKYKFIQDYKK